MTRHLRVWALASIMVMAPVVTAAQPADPVDQAIEQYELDGAFHKLGRGVENVLMGWVELPANVEREYSSNHPVTTFTVGLTKGTLKGLVRTGVGVYEVVTFLIPYPERFAPVLPPLEYHPAEPPVEPVAPGQAPPAP